MCATISSLLYETNKPGAASAAGPAGDPLDPDTYKYSAQALFYETMEQALPSFEGAGTGLDSKHRIFDDHDDIPGSLTIMMPPMATAVIGDTMIIAWRGSVRGPSALAPAAVLLHQGLLPSQPPVAPHPTNHHLNSDLTRTL